MADTPRIPLTPATVGFFLSLVAALTIGWNTVSYFKGLETKNIEQDLRLNRTDEDRIATKELSQKTGELKEAVVKLTTVMEQNVTQKRAENPLPSKSLVAIEPMERRK